VVASSPGLGTFAQIVLNWTILDLDCPVLFSYNSAAYLKNYHHEAQILMNDQNIQAVLKLEKKARSVYDDAVHEAEQLPVQAEQEAQAFIEKARLDAQNEARDLISKAEAKEEASRIMAEADEKAKQMEAAVKKNFDKAVAYVLKQVLNRE
jgi:vacuolar-type H+-ATPase subunit H